MLRRRQIVQNFLAVLGICLVLFVPGRAAQIYADELAPDLEVFVRAGCPHCEAAKMFLDELRRERPELRIVIYDIAENPVARQRLTTLVADRGMAGVSVPTFLVGAEILVGFRSADTTGVEIRTKLDRHSQIDAVPSAPESIKTTWLGELHVADLGLPLFTIVIGLLDGFNVGALVHAFLVGQPRRSKEDAADCWNIRRR